MINKNIIGLSALFIVTGALLAACGAAQAPAAPTAGASSMPALPPTATAAAMEASQPAAPAPGGQTLLQERCTACHTLNRVVSAHKTADQWAAAVGRMIGKGAQLSAEEKQVLVDYLAKTYP
jgi:cytochrome c5